MKLPKREIQRIADELDAEVNKRNEWYGLDNWDPDEVVEFVVKHIKEKNAEKMPEV